MLTNTSCTIFNKYMENGTLKYQSTILKAVHWEAIKGIKSSTNNASGIIRKDESVNIYIPFDVVATDTNDSPRTFLPYKEFMAKEYKTSFFTFQTEIKITSGAVLELFVSMAELERNIESVYTILTVSTLDFGSLDMKHWEIIAR